MEYELTKLTHKASMEAILVARMVLGQYRLYYEQFLHAAEKVDDPEWEDPTLYRQLLADETIKSQSRLIQAARNFLLAYEEVKRLVGDRPNMEQTNER